MPPGAKKNLKKEKKTLINSDYVCQQVLKRENRSGSLFSLDAKRLRCDDSSGECAALQGKGMFSVQSESYVIPRWQSERPANRHRVFPELTASPSPPLQPWQRRARGPAEDALLSWGEELQWVTACLPSVPFTAYWLKCSAITHFLTVHSHTSLYIFELPLYLLSFFVASCYLKLVFMYFMLHYSLYNCHIISVSGKSMWLYEKYIYP